MTSKKRKPKNDYRGRKKFPTAKDNKNYAEYMKKPENSATKFEKLKYKIRTDLADVDFRITDIYSYLISLLLLSNVIIIVLGYWDSVVIAITFILVVIFEFRVGILKRRKRPPYKKLTKLFKVIHTIGIVACLVLTLGFVSTNLKIANSMVQLHSYESTYVIVDDCVTYKKDGLNTTKCTQYSKKDSKEIIYYIKENTYFIENTIIKTEKDSEKK